MRVRNVEGLSLFFWRPFTISVMVTSMNAMQIVTFRMLVKFGPLLLALCACAGAPSTFDPNAPVDVLNGSPDVTNETLQKVMDLTNQLAPKAVNLNGWSIIVYSTVEESHSHCTSTTGEGDGCVDPLIHTIHVPWPSEYNGYDAATLRAESAEVLAHEMGHVFYFQTTKDFDHNHTHKEWFNQDDATSLCGRVYDAF